MKVHAEDVKYVPGTYAKKRPGAAEIAGRYIREWEGKHLKPRTPIIALTAHAFKKYQEKNAEI